MKEPQYPAILHFVSANKNDGQEYIVIAEEGPIKDHLLHGFECYGTVELDSDAISLLPLNQSLWKRT